MVDSNKFAGVSELFKSNNDNFQNDDNELMILDLEDLIPFHDHIFTRYSDEMLQELMNSIEDVGLLVPILCRDHPQQRGKFEILSGHNRVEACRALGMRQVHARIFSDLTDDEAKLIVIETNIKQRNLENFKLSERAAIVSEWHKLVKRQGLRTDLIRDVENQNNESNDENNSPFNLGKAQIWRYTRINEFLISELKDLLDDGKLKIKGAVDFTYLEQDEQNIVCTYFEDNKITDSVAKTIRKEAQDNVITINFLENLFTKKEKTKKEKRDIKVPAAIVDKYFHESKEEDVLNIIQLALEYYFHANGKSNELNSEIDKVVENIEVDNENLDPSLSIQLNEDAPDPDDMTESDGNGNY